MAEYVYFIDESFVAEATTTDLSDVFNPWKSTVWSFYNAKIEQLNKIVGGIFRPGTVTDEKLAEVFGTVEQTGSTTFRKIMKKIDEEAPELLPWTWLLGSHIGMEPEITLMTRDSYSGGGYTYTYVTPRTAINKLRAQAAAWPLTMSLGDVRLNGNGVFSHARRFLRNHDNTFLVDETYKSPSGIVSTYEPGHIGSYKLGSGCIHLTLSQSATRSALRRKLSHSCDVTKLLGDKRVSTHKRAKDAPREYEATLYGVELEVSTDLEVPAIIDAQANLFMACKADSTITGCKRNPLELVTMPLDLRTQRLSWAKFFGSYYDEETKGYPDFDVSNRTDNGMHIHVDRKAFLDEDHVRRFTFFIVNPFNNEFIIAMSERPLAKLNTYATLPTYPVTVTQKKIYQSCLDWCMQKGKYSAVNFQKSKTYEVRIFKGLFNYSTVVKNLEFVDALVNFTRDAGFQQLTLSSFMSWLGTLPKGRYRHLAQFLQNIDLQDILDAVKTKELLSGCSSGERAISILDKRGIAHTRLLAGVINNHFGGRKVVIWNNSARRIEITNNDKAVLHTFDGSALKHFVKKPNSQPNV